jgi:hypothetical protein
LSQGDLIPAQKSCDRSVDPDNSRRGGIASLHSGCRRFTDGKKAMV